MSKCITAHMIVQNEEQWVWYAIQSVLPYVESIILYDTGSQDKTVDIIRTIGSKKIIFEEKGKVTAKELVSLRNEQIERTKTEWFLLLDGDEVWPTESLKEHIDFAQKAAKNVMGIVTSVRMCVGDLLHVQDIKAGKYSFFENKGHFNIRFYRKKRGYNWKGVYPLEAYVDKQGAPIQNSRSNFVVSHKSYWHVTHLKRSSIDTHRKKSFEIGKNDNIKILEIFTRKRPSIVPSPFVHYSFFEFFYSLIRSPFLWIKRRL